MYVKHKKNNLKFDVSFYKVLRFLDYTELYQQLENRIGNH